VPTAALLQDVQCHLTANELVPAITGGSAEDASANSVTPVAAAGAGDSSNEILHFETTALLLGVDLRTGGYIRLSADAHESMVFTDIVISAIRVNGLTVEAS
jgi:hypothetical protein